MKQPVKAALYMRLSRDDEYYGDSVSIETQRKIIREFVQENGFAVVDEYIDDGWSGTNFERPDFQRMMDDVDSGKVNCIITKDLSRFGREHIQMDHYLEIDFPARGIRYIAVTDNEDTEKGLSDFVPFKNLFNEWFARDTSRKVKAALTAKFKAGERIFAYAPIGYKKDPDNKCHLLVDDDTKWIVEKIFALAVQGAGAASITNTLIKEQVPTPSWLNFQRDGTFANICEGQPDSKRYAWTIAQVKSILRNETYIGNTVHNKQTNISFKCKKRVRKSQEEWWRVEDTHEAIISREDFDKVQKQIDTRRRRQKSGKTQIFSGLVKCADCGWSLAYGENRQNKTPYAHYHCSKYGQGTRQCTMHYIRYDLLYAFVLARLQYWAREVHHDMEAVKVRLLKVTSGERAAADKRAVTELKRAKKRLAETDTLLTKLYEDRVGGVISERNFSMLSQKYQQEQETLDAKIETLTAQLDKAQEEAESVERWVELVRQYSDMSELTAELLNALIEKIVVHEATKNEDGIREQKVEIYYRFVGKID